MEDPTKAVILVAVIADSENSTLAPLTVVDQSGEGTEKVY